MSKLTYEFVKDRFEKEGYELLSKEYINQRTKLRYKCPIGHEHSINWSDWKQNRRCSVCGLERRSSKRRLNFDIIKNAFSSEGYTLLAAQDKYENVDQRLDFICPKGHRHSMNYHNWRSGWRCTYCHRENLAIIFSGPGSSNWKGGISCEPYCDAWADKEYKEDIKARDNYGCQNPGCRKINKQLCLHHINYDKKECGPTNLITLCKSCNSRANYNREWHRDFYSDIIKKKYNYKEV